MAKKTRTPKKIEYTLPSGEKADYYEQTIGSTPNSQKASLFGVGSTAFRRLPEEWRTWLPGVNDVEDALKFKEALLTRGNPGETAYRAAALALPYISGQGMQAIYENVPKPKEVAPKIKEKFSKQNTVFRPNQLQDNSIQYANGGQLMGKKENSKLPTTRSGALANNQSPLLSEMFALSGNAKQNLAIRANRDNYQQANFFGGLPNEKLSTLKKDSGKFDRFYDYSQRRGEKMRANDPNYMLQYNEGVDKPFNIPLGFSVPDAINRTSVGAPQATPQQIPFEVGGFLPEYGYGSWLQDNASGLLSGAGSLVSMIPGFGQIAGPLLSVAGSVVDGEQQKNAGREDMIKTGKTRLRKELGPQATFQKKAAFDTHRTFEDGGKLPFDGEIGGQLISGIGSIIGGIQQGNAAQDQADQQQLLLDEQAQLQNNMFAVEDRGVRSRNLVNDAVNYGPSFMEDGGQLGQEFAGQPQITEYTNGQKHGESATGGIPVDARGNPATTSKGSAVGLTEKGEVTWNGYVFSDKLKF